MKRLRSAETRRDGHLPKYLQAGTLNYESRWRWTDVRSGTAMNAWKFHAFGMYSQVPVQRKPFGLLAEIHLTSTNALYGNKHSET